MTGDQSSEARAVEGFGRAQGVTTAPGVLSEAAHLLDVLAATDHAGVLAAPCAALEAGDVSQRSSRSDHAGVAPAALWSATANLLKARLDRARLPALSLGIAAAVLAVAGSQIGGSRSWAGRTLSGTASVAAGVDGARPKFPSCARATLGRFT